MVRELRADEIREAAKFGMPFFAEGQLPGEFIGDVFASKWTALFELGVGCIHGLFDEDQLVGILGAVSSEDLNNGDMTASECFWFVDLEQRGRGLLLVRAYEAWARKRGCKRISMVHLRKLQPERLAQVYTHLGYQEIETHYWKEI